MNLPKAIEEIQKIKANPTAQTHVLTPDGNAALSLGIEALKFVAMWNKKQLPQHQIHLPGVTEEE
jgi:hypothetical protein